MDTQASPLVAFSNGLADAIEAASHSVVSVDARRRVGSSGFFVRPGLILTADHAIDDDDGIDLTFADGTTERATIAGRDATTDLTLVRSRRDVPALGIDPARTPRVGALAFAVARDDDGDLAATMGVVGAVGAAWQSWRGGMIDRWIRPDLALSPQFSGGPLVDVEGWLIGMNTWGLSRRHALTIPASTLARVIDVLASGRRIARGYLGIALQEVRLSERVANDAGLNDRHAIVAVDVESGGPADRAGVIVGDVIVALQNARITDSESLARALAPHAAGTEVSLRIIRGGGTHAITAEIGERVDAR